MINVVIVQTTATYMYLFNMLLFIFLLNNIKNFVNFIYIDPIIEQIIPNKAKPTKWIFNNSASSIFLLVIDGQISNFKSLR